MKPAERVYIALIRILNIGVTQFPVCDFSASDCEFSEPSEPSSFVGLIWYLKGEVQWTVFQVKTKEMFEVFRLVEFVVDQICILLRLEAVSVL